MGGGRAPQRHQGSKSALQRQCEEIRSGVSFMELQRQVSALQCSDSEYLGAAALVVGAAAPEQLSKSRKRRKRTSSEHSMKRNHQNIFNIHLRLQVGIASMAVILLRGMGMKTRKERKSNSESRV
ncbi:hypothetical protein TIFTF001_028863 [Ficus carica]|uniref:Uncharacterized protein n=1 Tax=Ficus carica TaxID=3494 RepID=A0AA88J1N6_FICCA|nr:hypothetical protein TIFTF001_028863 [Ficus carica]